MNKISKTFIIGLLPMALLACGNSNKKANSEAADSNALGAEKEIQVEIPAFDADSAYHYIDKQVSFGPRVPNTKAHQACADYLTSQLEAFGAVVFRQDFDAIAYDGTILKSSNIIGAYNPESKRRIALFAHWDTRPWADNDPNPKNHHNPVLGANDGGSGVGVLLEVARQINIKQPALGIDIILFDAEDYGSPTFYKGVQREDHWCLGSQYWSRVPHVPNYTARFGILLDMVGGKDATFYQEGYSLYFAKKLTKKVWNKAHQLGYNKYFIDQEGGTIVDDHLFVNKITNIKTIDIIPYFPNNEQSSFRDVWHTVNDDMEHISKETLKAVGQTVLAVIYEEK